MFISKVAAFVAMFGTAALYAQEVAITPESNHSHTENSDRCYTMQMDAYRRAKYPELPSLEENEIAFQQDIEAFKASQGTIHGKPKKSEFTIPIIFHIFTDGAGPENVSEAQIQAQIEQLNIDFANQAGSAYSQAADIGIQFCLAVIDESGNELTEHGINRVTAYGEGPFNPNDLATVTAMMSDTQWNPDDYFNVWVADISGGLLGVAQFPDNSGLAGTNASNGPAGTDGCVVLYSTIGSLSSPFPGGAPYNRGRTLTHEIGHCLGLRHIWGDGGCSADDFCNDTPGSDASNFGCPNVTNCGTVDMVENYMDYTDDACMNTFTEDQKTRMLTVMNMSPRRMTLGQNQVCSLITANLEELEEATFGVSPNPSNGVFNVKMRDALIDDSFMVRVIDISGRIVLEEKQDQKQFAVDLTNMTFGTYTIMIQTSKNVMTKRVVLK